MVIKYGAYALITQNNKAGPIIHNLKLISNVKYIPKCCGVVAWCGSLEWKVVGSNSCIKLLEQKVLSIIDYEFELMLC